MNDKERAARDKQYRAAIWEKATEALLRIEDDELRRHVAEQLHRQGQNRVQGGVADDGNADSVVIWVEVLVAGEWVTITHFRPADVGMTLRMSPKRSGFCVTSLGLISPTTSRNSQIRLLKEGVRSAARIPR